MGIYILNLRVTRNNSVVPLENQNLKKFEVLNNLHKMQTLSLIRCEAFNISKFKID